MNGQVTGYKEDIRDALNGIAYAANRMASQFTARGHSDMESLAYRDGFADALQSVGLVFGIPDFTDDDDD